MLKLLTVAMLAGLLVFDSFKNRAATFGVWYLVVVLSTGSWL